MNKEIMSIARTNEKKRMIHTQLASKKILTKVSIVEIKDEKDFDKEKTLQIIIDEETKKKIKKKLKDKR